MKITPKHSLAVAGGVLVLVVAACSSGTGPDSMEVLSPTHTPVPTATPAQPSPVPTLDPIVPTDPAATSSAPTPTPESSPPAGPATAPEPTPTPAPTVTPTPSIAVQLDIFTFSTRGWKTDFFNHTVDFDEITSAQVKDGIPSIEIPEL